MSVCAHRWLLLQCDLLSAYVRAHRWLLLQCDLLSAHVDSRAPVYNLQKQILVLLVHSLMSTGLKGD